MEKKAEGLFQINGKVSWVHCTRIQGAKAMQDEHSYHYHEYVEFLLFLQGNARLIVHDESYFCHAGQLAVVNAGEPHDVIFDKDSDYICIKFLPQIIYDGENEISEFRYAVPYLLDDAHSRVFDADEMTRHLLQEVMQEWTGRQYGCELVIRANLLKVFAAVMRDWYREGACAVAGRIPGYIGQALDHIALHYADTSEKETAAACGVSYHHFSAAFRQALGRTFSQYLTAVRIREAKKLLAMSDGSVEQIAGAVGFATASHFIKRFKDCAGLTPAQYRKQLYKKT